MFAASDIGWSVGHTCILYAPLLAGASTVLFEGKPVRKSNARAFCRIVEEHVDDYRTYFVASDPRR